MTASILWGEKNMTLILCYLPGGLMSDDFFETLGWDSKGSYGGGKKGWGSRTKQQRAHDMLACLLALI